MENNRSFNNPDLKHQKSKKKYKEDNLPRNSMKSQNEQGREDSPHDRRGSQMISKSSNLQLDLQENPYKKNNSDF